MLAGKVVLVTGASRGIGEAVARALAWRGARVGLFARSREALEALERELDYPESGGRALALPGDVTRPDDLRAAVERLEAAFGLVWALVNSAGVGLFAPVWELSEDDWARVRATNLDGAFYAMRAVLPTMLREERGTIVHIGSLASRYAFAGGTAYNASKFGLLGLAEASLHDLRPRGVRVSTILPGSVNTTFSSDRADADWKIQPTDVAETVLYVLESDTGVIPSVIELRPRRSKPAR
ncbi:SDR family NAD(P)-dependent oxidoreductase [Oceanithermus sp.]